MPKKIMFSDRYGLTEAVLNGKKTMTRRIVKDANLLQWLNEMDDGNFKSIKGTILSVSPYKVGEVVAIAQSYKDAGYTKEWVAQHVSPNPNAKQTDPFEKKYPGWTNKMFVKAEFMGNDICITDIKVERLQDISDEDCLLEGIRDTSIKVVNRYYRYTYPHSKSSYHTPREAFANLIDKVSGRGTWDKNPWVFAYTFELVK